VRLLRLLRLARLAALAVEGLHEVRDVLRRRGLSWVLLIALALNLIAAALVLSFERDTPASNIHSYPDALWWAVTTITTVGYGDRFPMSPAGRGVAVVLMVSGHRPVRHHHRLDRRLLRGAQDRAGRRGRPARPHPGAARRDRTQPPGGRAGAAIARLARSAPPKPRLAHVGPRRATPRVAFRQPRRWSRWPR
jgi:Ion channel